MPLVIGDHVRVKATGDIMVIEGKDERAGQTVLLLTRYGHMAGGVNISADLVPYREDEVTRVVAVTEWVDADE
jgi:hypothetical protein